MISRDALIKDLARYLDGEYSAECVVDRLLELVEEDRGILDFGRLHAFGLVIEVSELELCSDTADWARSLTERYRSGDIAPYTYKQKFALGDLSDEARK